MTQYRSLPFANTEFLKGNHYIGNSKCHEFIPILDSGLSLSMEDIIELDSVKFII